MAINLAFLFIISFGTLNVAAAKNSSQLFGPYPVVDALCNKFALDGCKDNFKSHYPDVTSMEACEYQCRDVDTGCTFYTYNQNECKIFDYDFKEFVAQCRMFGSPVARQQDMCEMDPCMNYLHMNCRGLDDNRAGDIPKKETKEDCRLACEYDLAITCEYFLYDQTTKDCYLYTSTDQIRECGYAVVAKDAEHYTDELPCDFFWPSE